MTLNELGWSPFFARHFESSFDPSLTPARVVRQEATRWLVQDEHGVTPAVLNGVLLSEPARRPIVGDWVLIQRGESLSRIEAVLPRRTSFSRKEPGEVTREQAIAANLDVVFLLVGLDGDFNLARIERYVDQIGRSGADPVVLLNKADVCDDAPGRRLDVMDRVSGVPVHAISALRAEGLDPLAAYLEPAQTVAFLGSSGAGKSTLLNTLLNREEARTAPVRASDSRGRHTTTHRELFVLPGGALVIDTPGMRELQLWADADEGLSGFDDIDRLALECRFADCTHVHEPDCAVQAALASGRLDEARYRSFLKLSRELDYLHRRQAESYEHEERIRGRKFALMVREVLRTKQHR